MIEICNFCGETWESDGTEKNRWELLCIHVWLRHDETHLGISLKDTMRNGPTIGDDEE